MAQERLSLSLSKAARRRARAKAREAGSVSAYIERLIREDERLDQLRQFIDEHFAGVEVEPTELRAVRRQLGLPE
jgi:hypothetical protein